MVLRFIVSLSLKVLMVLEEKYVLTGSIIFSTNVNFLNQCFSGRCFSRGSCVRHNMGRTSRNGSRCWSRYKVWYFCRITWRCQKPRALFYRHAALHCPGYLPLLGSDDQSWGWNLVDNTLMHNGEQLGVYPRANNPPKYQVRCFINVQLISFHRRRGQKFKTTVLNFHAKMSSNTHSLGSGSRWHYFAAWMNHVLFNIGSPIDQQPFSRLLSAALTPLQICKGFTFGKLSPMSCKVSRPVKRFFYLLACHLQGKSYLTLISYCVLYSRPLFCCNRGKKA